MKMPFKISGYSEDQPGKNPTKNKINIFIDFNNLSMRIFFIKSITSTFNKISRQLNLDENGNIDFTDETNLGLIEKESGLYKNIIFRSLAFFFRKINKERPDLYNSDKKIIIAVDSKSWRKDISPEYKANRKKDEADRHLWDTYYYVFHSFIEELKHHFTNWYIMKSDKAEADDIIAVLIQNKFNSESDFNFIISGDKDFRQILEFDLPSKVFIYDPMKEKFMDKEEDLLLKMILSGDRSDNILPVARGIGMKKAEKIINENKLEALLKNQDILCNFNTNKKLISLKMEDLPFFIVDGINNEFDNYSTGTANEMSIWKWTLKFYRDFNDIRILI